MDRNTVPELEASDVFASRAFKPPKGYLKSVRPLNPLEPSAPTLVKIKLLPWRVAEINAEEASFMIDAQLTTQWLDPGLAFKPQPGQPDPLKYELYMPQRQIWVPDLSFPSRTGQREHSEEIDTAIVSSDGVVIRRQRIAVTLTTILDLRWFPYDKHVFRIPLECQLYKGIHLRLEDANSNADHLKPNPSWDVDYKRAVSEEYEYDCCPGEPWSRFVVELDVARRPQTYITSICFPLMAVVAVAYSNFHLDRDAMDTRINLVVTMILTMIALQLVLVEWMPKIDYLTWMHYFLVSCYGAIMLMCLVMISVNKLITGGDNADEGTARETKLAFLMRHLAVTGIPVLIVAVWLVLFGVAYLSEPVTSTWTIQRSGRTIEYHPD